ncbi:helix-turn-helix domain-containing protein [Paenibacillus humicola]|uniref:helix-turn-helix domain-containing protein n=1 Tax=Paenibacillus humicola TaxID=3110540 RepID=UPI00237BB4B7|nr:helix-turn-helix transcriptional regulator [Paenibacillus humicola]
MLEWMLRQVMAQRGVWSGAALARLLQEKSDYRLSAPSISALLTGSPKQMKAETMDALCTALDCTPGDLWAYTPPAGRRGLKQA